MKPIPNVLFALAAGLAVAASEARSSDYEIKIERSTWSAERSRLTVTGEARTAPGDDRITILYDSGGVLGEAETLRRETDGDRVKTEWRLRLSDPAPVPCRIRAATQSGLEARARVRRAPADCGIDMVLNRPPVCQIAEPARGVLIETGDAIAFSGTASDPDGDPLTYLWTFEGAAPDSTLPEPGLVGFDAPGTFRATFAASDGQATCAPATITVSVRDPGGPPSPVAEQPFLQGSQFRVFANNDLGMHCADLGTAPFSVLPPFNNLNAQVVRRGREPEVLEPGASGVEIRYSAVSNPDDPVGPGSINSTSSNWPVAANSTDPDVVIRKSDFWDDLPGPDYPEILFGALLQPDQGLIFDQWMPGAADPYFANDPQPFGINEHLGVFAARGIPITPIDDTGRHNPYPLFRVQAVDRATGQALSTVDAVVPVSDEVNCQACHLRGQVGADPVARPDAGFVAASDPQDRLAREVAAKTNILRLHDLNHGDRYDPPLDGRTTVLCASCHESPALTEVGGPAGDPTLETMSWATHGFHGKLVIDPATRVLIRDNDGNPVLAAEPGIDQEPLIPIDPNDPDVKLEDNCFLCHPGQQTQCFRGAMRTAGLRCANCHGDLRAVGAVFPLARPNGTADNRRRPWTDEPRCESCHDGAAAVARFAYDQSDPSATPVLAADKRFAEAPGTLYRNSRGHGGLLCEACHGSPHAIWPVDDPAGNDNVAAVQLQGHKGTISECSVCHTSLPDGGRTLDGPHGMHPVANREWNKEHEELWKRDPSSCRTCHGPDLEGSRLSKTFADRVMESDREVNGSKRIQVAKGTAIGCSLCHDNPAR